MYNAVDRSQLNELYLTLKGYLEDCASRTRRTLDNGLEIINPSDGHYYGIWPDDFLFPIVVCPELLDLTGLRKIMDFLTESVVDLDCVPDRVEQDGLPIMSPGWYGNPLSYRMPAHLPAPWVRLLSYMESFGVEIPRKADWAQLIKRSFDQVSFACGLVYMDPQKPYVGFAYHDNIAITGLDLMSSLVIYKGLKRAVELFDGCIDETTLIHWGKLANGIENNIYKLYDPDIGGFAAGSKDCRQFNVWGNGLAYGLIDNKVIKAQITDFYWNHKDHIFKYGFTRQIAEEAGWQRLLLDIEPGHYMNGGYWPTGTGYVLPALMNRDAEFAMRLLTEMVANLEKFSFTEWIDEDAVHYGAKSFLMAIAIPMLAIKAVLENKPLIDYF